MREFNCFTGRVAMFCFMGALFLLQSSCSKSAPKCDSSSAVDAVIYFVGQDLKKDLSGLAGFSGAELSEEEWRMLRAGMVITVNNMREQGVDQGSGKRTCAGNVSIQNSGNTDIIPVTYVTELDASGEVKVSVSGLEARKGAPARPLIPEQ